MANPPGLKVEVFHKVLQEDYFKTAGASAATSSAKKKKKKAAAKPPRGSLVGSIDQGTSSTRFVVFTEAGRMAAVAQCEHPQVYPQQGWHEHDPLQIWRNTVACIQAVETALAKSFQNSSIKLTALGITNQRETTLAWNTATGKPYHNAIVWDDTRTADIVQSLGDVDRLRDQTGLPLASYFAGTKVRWLLEHVPELAQDVRENPDQVAFGTIDSWLLYQLTGTATGDEAEADAANVGGVHLTDVTNASRWLFMDLASGQWDPQLVGTVLGPDWENDAFPTSLLPEIRPSSDAYGTCAATKSKLPALLDGVPIAAVLGDQQAALFGQTAYHSGQAKNTYGTGLFLMMNTGTQRVPSQHGLLTTVAYQLSTKKAADAEPTPKQPLVYALEGSVSHSGSTIQWLRDKLKIIPNAAASEKTATPANDGCYLVPAFAGLFCPHWRPDARACLVGLTAAHHKGHVCRAALEAAAYQTYEVFQAMQADCQNIISDSSQASLSSLRVDGGGTHNKLLMQFQADMLGVEVIQPTVLETTALGAAYAAGLYEGVWQSLDELTELWKVSKTYEPTMEASVKEANLAGWNKAVSKSLNWVQIGDGKDTTAVAAAPVAANTSRSIAVNDTAAAATPKSAPSSRSSPAPPPSNGRPVLMAVAAAIAGLAVGLVVGKQQASRGR